MGIVKGTVCSQSMSSRYTRGKESLGRLRSDDIRVMIETLSRLSITRSRPINCTLLGIAYFVSNLLVLTSIIDMLWFKFK